MTALTDASATMISSTDSPAALLFSSNFPSAPCEARPSDYGIGLFATSSIAAGSPIISLPLSSAFSTSNILEISSEVETALGYLQEEAGWRLSERVVCLVALLRLRLLARALSDEERSADRLWKKYGTYYSALPKDFSGHPITWLENDETKRLLAQSHPALSTALNSKLRTLTREFETGLPYLSKLGVEPQWDDWIWCDLVYTTRVLGYGDAVESIQLSSEEPELRTELEGITVMQDCDRYVLAPGIDFANHSESPNARWRPRNQSALSLELVATRDIAADDEITISYAEEGADGLLFTHGIPPATPTASVQLVPPEFDEKLPSETPIVLARLGIKGRGVVAVPEPGMDGLGADAKVAVLLVLGCLLDSASEVAISDEGIVKLGDESFVLPKDSSMLLARLESENAVSSRARSVFAELLREELNAVETAVSEPAWSEVPEALKMVVGGRKEVLRAAVETST